MRKLLSVLLLTLASCGIAAAQGNPNTQGQSTLSHVGGVYVSRNYSYWGLTIDNASSVPAASPATFILRQGSSTLPDGRVIYPFVGEIVNVGAGSVQESVTLTAVSGCFLNAPVDSCTISGNTSNAHGRGELVTSGTNGIGEAMGDAANNGGGNVYWECDAGNIVLATGSVTNTTSCQIPKTWQWAAGSIYVTTTVTTAASESLGYTGQTTTIMTSCTALTAGTNCSQFIKSPTTLAGGSGFSALLITMNANPGAGALHTKVWGVTSVQSNF